MSRKPLIRKQLVELAEHIFDSYSSESFVKPFRGSDGDSYRPSYSDSFDGTSDSEASLDGSTNTTKCKRCLQNKSTNDNKISDFNLN